MINKDTNSLCSLIANYLYTDMGITPESATSDDVEEAMGYLYFKGHSKSEFRDKMGGIKMSHFIRIVDHMWIIDSYS